MPELAEMFRAFSEGSQGTFQQNEFFRQEQQRLEKERTRAKQEEAATATAMDAVVGLDLLNQNKIDDFHALTNDRVKKILFGGRNPDDTIELDELVQAGKIDEAKDQLKTVIRAAQLRLPNMPKDDEMIQNILGEKTTGMQKAEAEVQTEITAAAENRAQAAQARSSAELAWETFRESKRQFEEEQAFKYAELAQKSGAGDEELRKANLKRLSELNGSSPQREGMVKTATELLSSFKADVMQTGTTRRVAGWFPGVFTDQAQWDQELDALSEEIARTRLKAAGEIRPTDADVEGMKNAGPNVKFDEGTNITLLERFLSEQGRIQAEQDALRKVSKDGKLGFYTGYNPQELLNRLPEGSVYNGDGTYSLPDGTIVEPE